RMWKTRLAGASDVLGRSVRLNGEPYTVVGVMPASFDYARDNEELWVPAAFDAETLANHDRHNLSVYGLLKPGVSVEHANQDALVISRDLQRRFPLENTERGFRIQPFKDLLAENYRERLWILFGAVALVLLIACSNVSNMLLARGAGRARELSTRAALGASRGRIARERLTEGVGLGDCGGAHGAAALHRERRPGPLWRSPRRRPRGRRRGNARRREPSRRSPNRAGEPGRNGPALRRRDLAREQLGLRHGSARPRHAARPP